MIDELRQQSDHLQQENEGMRRQMGHLERDNDGKQRQIDDLEQKIFQRQQDHESRTREQTY